MVTDEKTASNAEQPRREPFDYTEWRRDLFKDVPLDELLKKAAAFREQKRQSADVQ